VGSHKDSRQERDQVGNGVQGTLEEYMATQK